MDAKALAKNLPKYTDTAGGYYKDAPLILAGWDGNGKPKIDNTAVRFNGGGKHDDEVLDHETFSLPQVYSPRAWETMRDGAYGAFCKTARKPYDLMVVACLFAAKHRFGPDFEFSSDGDPEDLQPGYDFWLKVCKPESPAPLGELVAT